MAGKKCIFCKIASGEGDTDFLYETDHLVVFKDIKPSAPIHYLMVPKKHFNNFLEAPDEYWLEVKQLADIISQAEGHKGFRLATNYGDSAMIQHMHVHYLSGITKSRKV